jgi:hypothetical protein
MGSGSVGSYRNTSGEIHMNNYFKIAAKAAVVLAGVSTSNISAEAASCENLPYSVIDLSKPINRMAVINSPNSALDEVKKAGVKTIIRYYDHQEKETIPCKTLLDDELNAIFSKGLSVAVIFQHHNDDPETFLDPKRGAKDAERALFLAEANGQPYKSAIYFGVDGVDQDIKDFVYEAGISNKAPELSSERKEFLLNEKKWKPAAIEKYARKYARFMKYHIDSFPDEKGKPLPLDKINAESILPAVYRYFKTVKAVFDKASGGDPDKSYRIGAYGSGQILTKLRENDFVEYTWVSLAKGHPGSEDYRTTDNWNLSQEAEIPCSWSYQGKGKSMNIDVNIVQPGKADFGQWSTRRHNSVVPRPATCPMFGP